MTKRINYLVHGNTKHGQGKAGKRSPAYLSWMNMKGRCLNVNNPKYLNYGGRGIEICERWLLFKNFFEDMGEPPKGFTLERKNNDGNYEHGNCKWIPKGEQGANKQNTVYLTINNETKTVTEWAKITGVPIKTIYTRLSRGVSVNQAVYSIRLVRNAKTA